MTEAPKCALIADTTHPTLDSGRVEWWSDLPAELEDHNGLAPSPSRQRGSWLYRVATFRKGTLAVLPPEEVDHVSTVTATLRAAGHPVHADWRDPLTLAVAAPIFSLN